MKTTSKQLLLVMLVMLLASLACNLGRGSSSDPDISPTTALTPTILPTPTMLPTQSVQLGAEYFNDELGFAFNQVPGWEVVDEGGYFTHRPPGADTDKRPGILLFSEVYETDISLDQVYAEFVSEFVTDDGSVVIDSVFETFVDGLPARGVEISGRASDDSPILGQVYLILVAPRESFVLFGFATDTGWVNEVQSYVEAVTDSLVFYEPIVEETTIDELGSDKMIRQWGSSAIASSEYTSSSWSAMQVIGEPDVFPECGDIAQAWAPLERGSVDWVEIFYATPVIPREINIYETYNPGYVVAVDVVGTDGQVITVFDALPEEVVGCSAILELRPDLSIAIESVVIYLDTTDLDDWAEIDAVELVGIPSSE